MGKNENEDEDEDEDSDDHCSIIRVYKRSLGGTLLPLFESRRRKVTCNGSPNRKRRPGAFDFRKGDGTSDREGS